MVRDGHDYEYEAKYCDFNDKQTFRYLQYKHLLNFLFSAFEEKTIFYNIVPFVHLICQIYVRYAESTVEDGAIWVDNICDATVKNGDMMMS